EGIGYNGFSTSFQVGETPAFIDKLVDLINKSHEGLDTVVRADAAPPPPGGAMAPAPPRDTPGLGLLLEMVAASAPGEGKVPTFASGFAAATGTDGREQVEPYLLVQFGQLTTFRSTLN